MSEFQDFLDNQLGKVTISQDSVNEINYEDYDIFSEIRKMISDLRSENGITQKELASRTGLTQANISNIEKGLAKPTVETLKKIADVFGKRLVIDFEDREVL